MRNGFISTRNIALRWLAVIGVMAQAASYTFAACTGTSPNIVCTSNAGPISLSAAGSASLPAPASIYPSENVVSGLSGTIAATGSGVRVRLNGLTLDWVFNLQVMLVSPSGTPFIFWSNIGQNQQVNLSNATITLSDAAASDLPQNTNVASGTY